MKLENDLHRTENFDLIEKKEIWSKNFETGKIAGLLYQIKIAVGWRGRKAINFYFFSKSRNNFFANKTIPKLVNESGKCNNWSESTFTRSKDLLWKPLFKKSQP